MLLSSSSVFPEPTAAAFELAAKLGYDGVEVMVWTDAVSQDAGALRGLSEHYGVHIGSIHAPCLLVTQRVWSSSSGVSRPEWIRRSSSRKISSASRFSDSVKTIICLTLSDSVPCAGVQVFEVQIPRVIGSIGRWSAFAVIARRSVFVVSAE